MICVADFIRFFDPEDKIGPCKWKSVSVYKEESYEHKRYCL